MNMLQELYQKEMEKRSAERKVKQALREAFPDIIFTFQGHCDVPMFSFFYYAPDGDIDSAEVVFDEQGELVLSDKLISTKDRAWHEDMVAQFNAVVSS